jgi:hypothetical protein
MQFCRAEERQAQQTLSHAVERGSFSSQRYHSQSPPKPALVGYAVGVVFDQEPRPHVEAVHYDIAKVFALI